MHGETTYVLVAQRHACSASSPGEMLGSGRLRGGLVLPHHAMIGPSRKLRRDTLGDAHEVAVERVELPPLWRNLVHDAWEVAPRALTTQQISSVQVMGRDKTVLNYSVLDSLNEYDHLYWLFAQGLLPYAPPKRQHSTSKARKRLFLVPLIPLPASFRATANISVLAELKAGLIASVRASVKQHPSSSGGPNHFIVVSRICSCFISVRRPAKLGLQARDACQPFKEPDLRKAVRVLSYEQVSSHDRNWWRRKMWQSAVGAFATPPGELRSLNLPIPYPSSVVPSVSARSLPLKTVRIFSAFGVQSNFTSRSISELRQMVPTVCPPSELSAWRQSSCGGIKCRFLLRAFLLQQLSRRRAPEVEREREIACLANGSMELRSTHRCPHVMPLVFRSARHAALGSPSATVQTETGDGASASSTASLPSSTTLISTATTTATGRPTSTASSAATSTFSGKSHTDSVYYSPLELEFRSEEGLLSVYRVMLASTFCLQPGGDSPTRKSIFDSISANCIPVLFRNDSTLFDSLAFSDELPYRDMFVTLPMEDVLLGRVDVVDFLDAVPAADVRKKQTLMRRALHALQYTVNAKPTLSARGGGAVAQAVRRLAIDA